MVLDLISIDTLVNTVISNYFGQVWIFGLAVIAFFIVVNLSLGIDFQGSIILSIPISLALYQTGYYPATAGLEMLS